MISTENIQLNYYIDKEELFEALGPNAQHKIFEKYLGIWPFLNKKYCSPLRSDNTPGCSFFERNGTLFFSDFAATYNGRNCLDCFGVVQYVNNCDYKTALKIVAEDFGLDFYSKGNLQKRKEFSVLNKIRVSPVIKKIITIEERPFAEIDFKYWTSQYGVTKETLELYEIYPTLSVMLDGNVICRHLNNQPIYSYKLDLDTYKVYRPYSKYMKWISNGGYNIVQGEKQLRQCPLDKTSFVIVTKSLKDVAFFRECGYDAVAPFSETSFINEELMDYIENTMGKKIIVNYDKDTTGYNRVLDIQKRHKSVSSLFVPNKFKAKDFTDLCKEIGLPLTAKTLHETLNNRKKSPNTY
jgi:hypothetical protein